MSVIMFVITLPPCCNVTDNDQKVSRVIISQVLMGANVYLRVYNIILGGI